MSSGWRDTADSQCRYGRFLPAVLLSHWLNIKCWQTPPPHPHPLIAILLPSFPLNLHGSLLFIQPHPFLLFSPRFPSTLSILSAVLPRASTWSPWWFQGRPMAVSCRVKVKVFMCLSPFYLVRFSPENTFFVKLLDLNTDDADWPPPPSSGPPVSGNSLFLGQHIKHCQWLLLQQL